MKKLKFETKNVSGEKLELEVRLPSAAEKNKGRFLHAKTWRDAVANGVMLKDELDKFLVERGLWGDGQEKEYDELGKQIRDKIVSLKQGGSANLTKATGKELALEVVKLRDKRNSILSKKQSFDNHTAESIADQAQFDYFVATCTLRTDGVYAGKSYFTTYEEFKERGGEDSVWDSSTKFYELQNSQGSQDEESKDEDTDLPEIKFLKDNGFINDKSRLIDTQGRLIDDEGRLIDNDNRYINESGEYIDIDGNRVDDKGNLLVESSPLLEG